MYRVNSFAGSKSWLGRVHVALVCVCATGAALGAPSGDRDTTVFYDAQVFTAEPDHPYADAVAIRGTRILAVGDLAAVAEAAGPGARKVDLKGGFLMPGMIDGHAHPIAGGVTLIQANYPDTQDSIPNLTQFVAGHVQKKDSRLGDVLVVNGIDIGYWAHAAEIDAALSRGIFCRSTHRAVRIGWAHRMGQQSGTGARRDHRPLHPPSAEELAALLRL